MSNIRFGFFKQKLNAGGSSATSTYPAYPTVPTFDNFNTFVNLGYVSNGGPVANIDTDKGNIIANVSGNISSTQSFTLPRGNVLLYSIESLSGNSVPHIYIYDFQTKTITDQTPGSTANVDADFRTGSLALNNNVFLYDINNSPTNKNYAGVRSINIDTLAMPTNSIANVWAGNIAYPGGTSAITLLDGNVFIAPQISNNTFFTLHVTQSITTSDHGLGGGNVTFDQGYLVASTMQMDPSSSGDFINIIQDPVTEVVYIIPGDGFKANANVSETKRSIGVYNPSSNISQRIQPANINLDDRGAGLDGDTLYQGVAYGVDKNIYAFPGEIKKDILVFNPATQDGTQSTFNIFDTTGANTITCVGKTAILATDGNIYIRAKAIQPANFSGNTSNIDCYLSIDTKPGSSTYQKGNLFLVDPNNTSPGNVCSGYAIAGDNLILGNPFGSGEAVQTLQINAPTGFNQISVYPPLRTNNRNDS